jgi:hypothetical protein
MTCGDCLAALATASLREMTPDSAVMQHCATCPDCARVTTMLREREYETATVLNSIPPMSNPLTVAETAVRTAQRRRVGRVVVMLSGAALVVTIWIAAAMTIIPALNRGDIRTRGAQRTETMALTCLSPQQAADMINPYVRSNGSEYWLPGSGISAITVRGTREELAKSRDLIREFDKDPNAACHSPASTLLRLRQTLEEADGKAPTLLGPPSGKAPTLLGPPSGKAPSLLGPSGSGTLLTPDKATTPPKKQ